MNPSLDLLMKKLLLQLESLEQQIKAVHIQMQAYQNDMQILQIAIEDASNIPLQMNPEKEMARLSFTLQKQGACEQLAVSCKDQESELERLTEKVARIRNELELLQKYHDGV